MPDCYTKFPRPQSITFFERAMRNHNKVRKINKLSDSYYEIVRLDLSSIRVFVSNYYALSLADYYEVLEEYSDIDCLITISNWNGVTQDAYAQGKRNSVGVFKMDEFLGAINFEEPSRYIRPIDREDNEGFCKGFGR